MSGELITIVIVTAPVWVYVLSRVVFAAYFKSKSNFVKGMTDGDSPNP